MYQTSQSQLSNVFHHNQQNKQDTASSSNLFYSGFGRNSPSNFNSISKSDSFNKSVSADQSNLFSFPPQQVSTPPPSNFGTLTLEQNSNPYRTSRGGKRRSYQTTNLLFGENSLKSSSDFFEPSLIASAAPITSNLFSDRNAQELTHLNESLTFQSHTNYSNNEVNSFKQEQYENKLETIYNENTPKCEGYMGKTKSMKVNPEQNNKLKENEKNLGELIKCFENDNKGSITLIKKPLTKEERKEVRDRARKARMRIKNQDDNSNNFEGLINEISSQGTSLCSDVSTDVYLQDEGLDSNSSNDFFELNQREQQENSFSSSALPNSSVLAASKSSYYNEPPSESSSENITTLQDSSLWKTSLQHNYIKTQLEFINDHQETSQQFHDYVEQHNHSDSFYNNQPNVSIVSQSFEDINFFQNESKCSKPEPYDKHQVEHLRREESQIKTQTQILFKTPNHDPTLSTIESKSSDRFKQSEDNDLFVPDHHSVTSSDFNSITQHFDNTSNNWRELDYSVHDHNKGPPSEFKLLTQHSVSTIEHRGANDIDSYGTFEHTPVNDVQNYFVITSKEEEAYSLNNPLFSDDDNKTTTSGNPSCYDELPQLSSDNASRISPYQLIDASKYPAPSSLNSNNSSPLEMVQNVSIGSCLYEKINGASSGSININSFDMVDLTSETEILPNSSIVSPYQLSESHVEKLNFLEDENTINKQHFLKKKVSEILHNAEHGQYSLSSVTAENSSSYFDAANLKTYSSDVDVFPRQSVDQNSVSLDKNVDVIKQNSSYEPEGVNQNASFLSNILGSSNLNNADLNLSRGSTGESKEYEYLSLEKVEKVSANTFNKDVNNSALLNENLNAIFQKASTSESSFLASQSLHKSEFTTEQRELQKPSPNCNLAYENSFDNGYEAKEGASQYQEPMKSITYQTVPLLLIQNSSEVAQSQQKQIHERNQAEHYQTGESPISSYHETPSIISQLSVQGFPKSQVLNTEAAKKKLSYPNPITQQTLGFDMPLQSSQQEQQPSISVHDKVSSLQGYKDIFYSPLSHLNDQPPTQEYGLKNSNLIPVHHSTLKEASQPANQNKSFPVNHTDNTILVSQPADLTKNQIKSSNLISSQYSIAQPSYIAQDQSNSSVQGITQNQLSQQNIVGNQTFTSHQSEVLHHIQEKSKQLSNLSSAQAVNQPNNTNQMERPVNNQINDTQFNLPQNQAYPFSQNSTQGPVYHANSNFNSYSTGMPLINQAPTIPPAINDRTNVIANQQIPAPNPSYSTPFNQYTVQQPMVYSHEGYPPFSQYSHYGGLYPNAWPHNTLEQIQMQQHYEQQQYLDYYQQQAAYYNYYNQQLTAQFPPYPHYDYSQGYNWPGYYDQYSYGSSAASSVYESRPTSVIERRSSRNSDQALDELPDFSSDVSFQQQEVKEPEIKLIRSTPLSFTAVHLRVRFTPNDGKLCIVAPKQPLDGEVACIQNYAIESIIPIPIHKRFPGPLLRGDTNKKYILRLVQSTIQEILPSIYQNTNELVAQVALWEFVGLLVKQNGTYDGSDIADMLCALLPNTEVDGVKSRSLSMLSHSPKVVSDKTLEEYHHYMSTGQIRDGLEHSIKYEMWGHAFMLATSLGGRYLHHVQSRFMDSLKQSDPLKTLYSYISGLDVEYFKKQAAPGTWIQNLCILASNTSGDKQKDRERLIAFGDGLRDLQIVGAAHLCYLLAKVPFGLHTSKDAKIVLIGLEHRLDTSKAASVWAQPLNIQLTEIYQFAITLNDLSFTIPAFQNYKYEYALQLMEYGFSTEALAYFEAISEVILKEPTSEFFTWHLINGLIKYADLASMKGIKYYEEREVPDWFNQLHALSFKGSRHSSTSGNNIQSSNEYKKNTSEATGKSFSTQHSYSDSVNSNICYHSDDTQEEKLKTYEITASDAVQFDINNSDYFNGNDCNKNSDVVPNLVENISDLYIEEKINYENQETWHNQSLYQAESKKESVYSEEGFNERESSSREDYFSEQSISNNEGYQYGYPENDPQSSNTMWYNGSNENQLIYNQDYNYQDFSPSSHLPAEDIQASYNYETQPHIRDSQNEPELEPEEDLFREFSKKKNNDGINDNLKKANDELSRKPLKTAQPVNNKKGWLGSIISKFTPAKEVHLPDDKDNSIYYDEKLKRWVDKNEDPAETRKTIPPPPTGYSAPSNALITPAAPSILSSDPKIQPSNNLPNATSSSTFKRRSITKLQHENHTLSDKSNSVKEPSLSNDSDKKIGPPSRFSMRAQGGSAKRGLRYVNAMGNSMATTAPMAPVLDPFKIPGSNSSNKSTSQPIKTYFDPSQTAS